MMTDPDEANWWLSLKKVKANLNMQSTGDKKTMIYPAAALKACKETGKPPKCIFIPSKNVLKKMIRAIIEKPQTMTRETFLL